MIERLYLRELIGFKEVELEFAPGLVVLTGPSGAGKSILMQALLSCLGYGSSEARICEAQIARPNMMNSEQYEMGETITVKSMKKDRAVYYLENQKISKKLLQNIFDPYLYYLSVRDRSGLHSGALLELLDRSCSRHESEFAEMQESYRHRYRKYMEKRSELDLMLENERKVSELIEFAEFEVQKISSIEPREGEYEELMEIKKRLSRLDRIKEALERAGTVFDAEESVYEIFDLLDKDSSYFSDAMNQLREDFDNVHNLTEELAEVDVESVLDRLEKISSLISRYGSVSEALEYRDKKLEELEKYKNIEHDKSELESFIVREKQELETISEKISSYRKKEAVDIEKRLTGRLDLLKLPSVRFNFTNTDICESGKDSVDLDMQGSSVSTLSGGEFNRLRLALMSVAIEGGSREDGVVFLDEIDANVSGDESIAIAEMISGLAETYQVFAISHQPHLSARADQHILVHRNGDESCAKMLDERGRIDEISRIVGGENPNDEAIAFARKLRQ